MNTVIREWQAGEVELDVLIAALNADNARRGQGLFDRLQQGIALAGGLAGPVTAAEFPDHHAAQTTIARVADLGLAGVLVVVGNEFVVG